MNEHKYEESQRGLFQYFSIKPGPECTKYVIRIAISVVCMIDISPRVNLRSSMHPAGISREILYDLHPLFIAFLISKIFDFKKI